MSSKELNDVLIERMKRVWDNNIYYEPAEDWTFIFWDTKHPFRPLFDQLSTDNVLELAVGHGRHSAIVKDMVKQLTILDIVESNLEVCRKRFVSDRNISYILGTGADFGGVPRDSYEAIYCYDAMVHFPASLVYTYIKDTARVLKKAGRALYHHSNSEAAPNVNPRDTPHARAPMSAEKFKVAAEEAGLRVIEQKIIKWGAIPELDCITLLER